MVAESNLFNGRHKETDRPGVYSLDKDNLPGEKMICGRAGTRWETARGSIKERRGRDAGKANAEAKPSGHAMRTILYGGPEAQPHALQSSAL
jgi:hypothetical protein